jgi:hypothetical protein
MLSISVPPSNPANSDLARRTECNVDSGSHTLKQQKTVVKQSISFHREFSPQQVQ